MSSPATATTTVIRQKSGRYAIACTRPDCDHYESGILTEPAARYRASTHDAHHRRHHQ